MKRAKWDKHIWEENDIQFLKDNYRSMTNQELADGLGIKLTTCRTKLYSLGLKRMELEYWTEEQVDFLKENYQVMGDTEIAEIFDHRYDKKKGWSKKHIEKKRRYLKLKRTMAERKRIKKRNVKLGYFKDCPVNAWKTRGVTPEGEIKIWQIAGSPTAVIKLDRGFVHYNRWLFEQNYFTLPSDVLVVTKSGETIAKAPDDLKIIDRAEHARRNSLKRYPEELRPSVKLLRKLKASIHQKQNNP